jgi:hypothetical protein
LAQYPAQHAAPLLLKSSGATAGNVNRKEQEMRTPKVMQLVDTRTGLMKCPHCGTRHTANLAPATRFQEVRYKRGAWQCPNGCASQTVNAGQ